MSEPSGEIQQLRGEIREFRNEFRNEFRDFRAWAVPRGEWTEARRADQATVGEVAKDVEAVADSITKIHEAEDAKAKAYNDFRRQLWLVVLGGLVTSLGALIVALIVLILSGGKA